MISDKPNLKAIDFSQPDGEFIFQKQQYLIKADLENTFFFKKREELSNEFIYSFSQAELPQAICLNKYPSDTIEAIVLQKQTEIRRCIQYKDTFLAFGIEQSEYLSLKSYLFPKFQSYTTTWNHFSWKEPLNISLDFLLEEPYEFFLEQAKIFYRQDIRWRYDPIRDRQFDCIKATQQIEFICGSESQLKYLTKLAVFTLSELQPIFLHHSGIKVVYDSDNTYYHGGLYKIYTIDSERDRVYIESLSQIAKQLFNLIFEYNFFTGIWWEYQDGGGSGYTSYEPMSQYIAVEIPVPSQHERLEAALELQTWLEGKLPDDEIGAIFAR